MMKKWKTMKKWIGVLGVFCVFFICVLPVRADVIWEPRDSFYEGHVSACKYVGRTYTANGPDGKVILYESPVSARKVATWENGYKVYIGFSYEDEKGTLWGVWEDGDKSGWMPMEYMDVVYDNISFAQEYAAEIREQDGTLDERYLDKEIFFWSYPASPGRSSMKITDNLPEYHRTYTDSQGHIWGNVGYYYGHKNFWMCLDMPDAEPDALYPDTAPEIGASQPEEKDFDGERIAPEGGQSNKVALVAGLVLAVVLLTAGMLLVLKKRGGIDPWDVIDPPDDFGFPPL